MSKKMSNQGMRDLNTVFLSGCLIRSADGLKIFMGKLTIEFSLVIGNKFSPGCRQGLNSYIDVIAHGDGASAYQKMLPYLKDGTGCIVEGRLEQVPTEDGGMISKVLSDRLQFFVYPPVNESLGKRNKIKAKCMCAVAEDAGL